MKKILSILMLLVTIILGAETANAYTIDTGSMTGAISKYPIVMKLNVNTSTGRVTGWYYYKSKGSKNKIQLSGTMRGEPIDGADLTLTETVNGKKTGSFKGYFWITSNGSNGYNGTWTSTAGKRLDFDVMREAGY